MATGTFLLAVVEFLKFFGIELDLGVRGEVSQRLRGKWEKTWPTDPPRLFDKISSNQYELGLGPYAKLKSKAR